MPEQMSEEPAPVHDVNEIMRGLADTNRELFDSFAETMSFDPPALERTLRSDKAAEDTFGLSD